MKPRSVELSDSPVLYCASTPFAVLNNIGLFTEIGISSDDPSCLRHKEAVFAVLISIYKNGILINRLLLDIINPNTRNWYSIDNILNESNINQDIQYMCIVHRVNIEHLNLSEKNEVTFRKLDNTIDNYLNMYRTVIQYSYSNGSRDSVIYEMPPFFNARDKKSNFLSFSNMIDVLNSRTYLIFINASIDFNNNNIAECKLFIKDSSGNNIFCDCFKVNPFNFTVIDLNKYVNNIAEDLSYICVSENCSLIPISLIVSQELSNISLEHSHPPQEYIVADSSIINKIKMNAIARYMELP